MKRLIFLLLIALVPLEISAQSRLSDKGYVGDVSLSASFDSSIGAGVDLLTSHGYSFGNGLWLGGGTGVYMADKSDGMMLPIYTEARYSFLDINENAHPFVGCKMGYITDFDETISFTYTYAEGKSETVTDAVIIDGIFETPFYMISSMTSNAVKFYETAPASVDGDVYVGYMSKVSGMGATVYAYALNMKEDGTFDVSIMQMATVMHVWDMSHGTYTVDGDKVTFSYDVMDGEGAVATAGYTSEGTGFTENGLTVGLNIAQTTVRASAAEFIRVK